jgi:hypothetical protein
MADDLDAIDPEWRKWFNEKQAREYYRRPLKKIRIRMFWTCSDFVHHEHRWRWTAWLCGRWQRWKSRY